MAERRPHPSPGATALRRFVAVAMLLLLSGFAAVFIAFPGARSALVRENGIIQMATAMVFLVAAIGAVVVIRTGRMVPKAYWVVPAVGFLGFAGEIRFATRFIGTPTFTVDGEDVDSFHDVFETAVGIAGDAGIRPLHIILLAAAGVVAIGAVAARGSLTAVVLWLVRHRPIRITVAAVGVHFAGLALDLANGGLAVTFIEETTELAAAALLAMAAAAIAETHNAVVSWRRFDLELPADRRR